MASLFICIEDITDAQQLPKLTELFSPYAAASGHDCVLWQSHIQTRPCSWFQLVFLIFPHFIVSCHTVWMSLCLSPPPPLYPTDRRSLQVVKEHKEGLRWWVGQSAGGQREKCQRGDKDNTIWLQMIVSVISMDLGLHRNLSRAFLWWHRQSFHWVNDDVEVELPLLFVPVVTFYF